MMEAYFDESGIHDKAPVCLVAGFYGSHSAWRKFEKDWNLILKDHGLLALGFHAKVFFGRKDGKRIREYEDWSNAKARNFLNLLVGIVKRSRVCPIGYAVIVEDFLAMPLVSRLWFTGAKFRKEDGAHISGGCPNKSYYLPFQFSVLKATKSLIGTEHKMHVFAGLDRTFSEYARELYEFFAVDERLDKPIREALGTIAFPLAKDTPGLQAADLLAYRLYRGAKEKLQDESIDPSPLLMALLTNWRGKKTFPLINRPLLEGMEKAGREAYEKMMAEKVE